MSNRFADVMGQLEQIIADRKTSDAEGSYTAHLLRAHEDKVLKKIGEEATEVVLAAKDLVAAQASGADAVTEHGDTKAHLIYETSDLLYHVLVLCARYDISLDDIGEELKARFK